jgi:hypothetical protein
MPLIRGLIAFYLEHSFRQLVGFLPSEGHPMVTPEKLLAKRRRQIMNDGTDKPSEPTTHDDSWIKHFIGRLAGAIRKIGSNK